MFENSATKDVDISMTNISHFAHVYDMRYVLSEREQALRTRSIPFSNKKLTDNHHISACF